MQCREWSQCNELCWPFMAWEWPSHVQNIRAYLNFGEDDLGSGLKRAVHVQIKLEVLQAGDWGWLPRSPDLATRDRRTLKMAAAWIFQHPVMGVIGKHLSHRFKVWCEEHQHRKVSELGGTQWKLGEPSIYAIYQRVARWSSD